eukprot:1196072-Prorocentrum_minimum.AAC.4
MAIPTCVRSKFVTIPHPCPLSRASKSTARLLPPRTFRKNPRESVRGTRALQTFTTGELADAIVAFQREGAVCIRKAFDRHWVEEIQRGIDKNIEAPSIYGEWLYESDESEAGYFNDYCNWQRWVCIFWASSLSALPSSACRKIPEFEAYVRESGVAELARQLMQSPTAVFYHEHVLVRKLSNLLPRKNMH